MVAEVAEVVELEAGPVTYRSVGPEDGPVVLFVHGLLVDGSLWHGVADHLADQGFRAITPDWPLGSHRTPMAEEADLSPRGVARLVLDFIAALDLGPVTLVGNDTGGAICQLVIDADPEPVERLVLTNCDAFESFPPAFFKPLFRLMRLPGLPWLLMQPQRLTAIRHAAGFGPLVTKPLDADQTRRWVTPFLRDGGIRRDTRKLARGIKPKMLVDVASRFARYDRPVLVCWAPADRFFRPELARRLVDAFPDARLVEIADARTFLALDQPERVADEIATFAKS